MDKRTVKESDLLYAMKTSNRREIYILKEAKYNWNSSELIKNKNPIEVLELCIKYNVDINCSMYESLIKDNKIEVVKFAILNNIHDLHNISYAIKYINSEEMLIMFLSIEMCRKIIGLQLFDVACKNKFIKSSQYIKESGLTHSQIMSLFDLCDIELLKMLNIDLSMVKFLEPHCGVNIESKIITYGRLSEFNLIDHVYKLNLDLYLLMQYVDFMNFYSLRKIISAFYSYHCLAEFSVDFTIKIKNSNYFDTTLPEKLSEYLLLDLSKIVVSYL